MEEDVSRPTQAEIQSAASKLMAAKLLAASQTCVVTGLSGRGRCPTGDSVVYSHPQVPIRSQAQLLQLLWEQAVFRKWLTAFKDSQEPPSQCLRKPNYRVGVIHPPP